MAAKAPKKPRSKQPKQPYLGEGTEADMAPPSVKEIDDAAENYYSTMLERKDLTETEDAQADDLIDLMKEHGMSRYVLPDGKVVEVTAVSNVKVKKPTAAKEEGGDDDGE